MQPALDTGFVASPRWKDLSRPAQCALEGLLQFAMWRHGEWVVEGNPKDLGGCISDEAEVSSDDIVKGLRELDQAGCIKRTRCGCGPATRYSLSASIICV